MGAIALARHRLTTADPVRLRGHVTEVIGLVVESTGPRLPVGASCVIESPSGHRTEAEVVGFRHDRVLLMPLGDVQGIEPGDSVAGVHVRAVCAVGRSLIGRVIDGLGRPLDGRPLAEPEGRASLRGTPINPLERDPIREPIDLGVRAMNALLTCGRGQRLGIFAGSGVGKSSLLGMIARATQADVNVIALIGERGREVREFLERDLGPAGLARSVVVVATSDSSPLVRLRGALLASAIAEDLRTRGRQVLLLMDSLTRLAMAQREIGLSIGEPPTARGYTPSVFALLPKLVERAGVTRTGSITALYTVLVEGDDMNEPVADAVRGLLDGHVVLSRRLAHEGHYPAIDIPASLSRLMNELADGPQLAAARRVRGWLSALEEARDLIQIGAYVRGADPRTDEALDRREALRAFLCQGIDEHSSLATSHDALLGLGEVAP